MTDQRHDTDDGHEIDAPDAPDGTDAPDRPDTPDGTGETDRADAPDGSDAPHGTSRATAVLHAMAAHDNDDEDTPQYRDSYLLIRTVVGAIGFLLPVALVLGDYFFLPGSIQVRGSLSSYYHTVMRDLFVGSLCVVGFLLITYRAAKPRRREFWLSLVAGIAVLLVVFFPTERPDVPTGAPRCGDPGAQFPTGTCSPTEGKFGELITARVHFASAAVFILMLAAICFHFAYQEEVMGHVKRMRFHRACGWAILGAVAWVVVGGYFGLNLFTLTPLYLGEVVSVWAFGLSWLAKGKDLRTLVPDRIRNILPKGAAAGPAPAP